MLLLNTWKGALLQARSIWKMEVAMPKRIMFAAIDREYPRHCWIKTVDMHKLLKQT